MREYDYDKELKKFCEIRGIWDEIEERPTRFVINKLKTIGNRQEQDGFTIKRIKLVDCRICFKQLTGKQREFCSDSCRNENKQRKDKFHKLMLDEWDLIGISWKKDPDGKPQRKNIIATYLKNGKYHEKIGVITKKSGKPRNKNQKSFSMGKD